MAKTDLKLYSKAQGTEKKITTSLPYINPDANSTTLKQFAVKLNNLTTNIYSEADRVQTINVDTEQVPVDENAKLAPVFTKTSEGTRWDSTTNSFTISYNIETDGIIYVGYGTGDYPRDNFYLQYTNTTVDSTHKTISITLQVKEPITEFPTSPVGAISVVTASTSTYKAGQQSQIISKPA